VNINFTINHTNDGDLLIVLRAPGGTCTLVQYIGEGGQNFTNTTLDDSASVLISNASPPYTGVFKPMTALSMFNNGTVAGNWILWIYDNKAPNTGTLVSWCLNVRYSTTIGINENISVSKGFILYQNFPNPFNPSTKIKFQIPQDVRYRMQDVKLYVIDILGKKVQILVNEHLQPGTYEVNWNASDFPSGIYFYKLTAGEFTETKRLVLLK
jgi:hypothetical protein